MIHTIINSSLVVVGTLLCLATVFHPRVVKSQTWRATVTPLASIIGSGFLVLGPILKHSFGVYGIGVMALLCIAAYLFGEAIRFNIARYAFGGTPPRLATQLEEAAGVALTLAYVISIAYYVNLLGAFSLSLTPLRDPVYSRAVTTGVLAFIAIFGFVRGFTVLEKIEEGTVGVKLAIITGLLCGLVSFFFQRLSADDLVTSTPDAIGWSSIAVALGLVITVQGFETSRYLGSEFDAKARIFTMKLSQWISSAVYVGYIALVSVSFTDSQVPDTETGIINMTDRISPILPFLLVIAAVAAQFSAAVADTGGCGGLAEEASRGRIRAKISYLMIGAAGIALTWVADIYSIIAYASRAFAVYYALQCAIAAVFAAQDNSAGKHRSAYYTMLSIFALAIVIFGRSAEG